MILTETISFLRNIPLFVHISEENLIQVAKLTQQVYFDVGQEVVKPDGTSDCLYILQEGSASLVIDTINGVALHRHRGIIGEMTLFSPNPCTTTCLATTNITALQIEYKDIWPLVKRMPGLVLGVITELNRRLDELIDQMYRFKGTLEQDERPLLFSTQFTALAFDEIDDDITTMPEEIEPEIASRVTFLQTIPLFAHLTEPDLLQIAQITQKIHFRAGERFIKQHSLTESIYVIMAGTAEITIDGVGYVGTREVGEVVGEMALISRKPRTAHCTAITDTTALKFTHKAFWQLIKAKPRIALGIVAELNSRIEEALDNILRLSLDLRQNSSE